MDVVREIQNAAVRLYLLHHAVDGVRGAWMATELSHHGYRIPAGTLYPLLHRMEAAGLGVASSPQAMASLRNLEISLHRLVGATNIGAALRHHGRDTLRRLRLLTII